MKKRDFKSLLESQIPISKEMHFDILETSPEEVRLKLELIPNRNHKNTAFGGSIFSGCALASYTQVLHQLESRGFTTKDIVVAESTIKYKAPLRADFEIICLWALTDQERFFKELEKKHHSHVWLTCWVVEFGVEPTKESIAAEFTGRFVVKESAN